MTAIRSDSPVAEAAGAGAEVLVVDDHPATRYATARVLRAAGFRVSEAATGSRGSFAAALLRAIAAPFVRWYRRNEAYRQLASLDDRMLSDIGISRADIPALVNGWDGEPVTGQTEEDGSLLRGLRQWNRSRATAKALHALDNHMLDDIGLVRGDIDWLAEELAAQSVWTAANRNHEPRAA